MGVVNLAVVACVLMTTTRLDYTVGHKNTPKCVSP